MSPAPAALDVLSVKPRRVQFRPLGTGPYYSVMTALAFIVTVSDIALALERVGLVYMPSSYGPYLSVHAMSLSAMGYVSACRSVNALLSPSTGWLCISRTPHASDPSSKR
jgi:hypothetical protein